MKKKLLSVFLVVVMLVTLMQVTVFAANVTPIKSVTATSNYTEFAVLGGDSSSYNVTMTSTDGSGVRFVNISWRKYNESTKNWENFSGTFKEGKYRLYVQVREQLADYVLEKPLTLTVDGVPFSFELPPRYGSDYTSYDANDVTISGTISYLTAISPEIIIDKAALPLSYSSLPSMIVTTYTNVAINTVDLNNYIVGGTEPYTFTKVSGPSWMNVSSSGTVSGTPTAEGPCADLVVNVSDAKGQNIDIPAIRVRTVLKNPADREQITSVNGSMVINQTPIDGKPITSTNLPVITTANGEKAVVTFSTWQKKNPTTGAWEQVGSGTFTPGQWRIVAIVRVTGSDYILGDSIKAVIDGHSWERVTDIFTNDAYSQTTVASSIYNVEELPLMQSSPIRITADELFTGNTIPVNNFQAFSVVDGDISYIPDGQLIYKWQLNTSTGWTDYGEGKDFVIPDYFWNKEVRLKVESNLYKGEVYSENTIVVSKKENLTGTISIEGDARYNSPLFAVIGSSGVAATLDSSAIHYQWQVSEGTKWVDIAGATTSRFVPDASHVGKNVRVTVTTDNYYGTLRSSYRTVGKSKVNTAPVKPTVTDISRTGFKLNGIQSNQEYSVVLKGAPHCWTYEDNYHLNSGSIESYVMVANGMFAPEKTYEVATRIAGTATTEPGPIVKFDVTLSDSAYPHFTIGAIQFAYGDNGTYEEKPDGIHIIVKKGSYATVSLDPSPAYDLIDAEYTVGDLVYCAGLTTDRISGSNIEMDSSGFRLTMTIRGRLATSEPIELIVHDKINNVDLTPIYVEVFEDHVFSKVERREATCERNGNIEYYICDCGLWTTSPKHPYTKDNIIDDHSSVVISVDHEFGPWTEAEASCTEEGIIGHYHCSICGKDYAEDGSVISNVVIPKKAHDYLTIWRYLGDVHYHRCKFCEEKKDIETHVSSGPATEDTAEFCVICDAIIHPALGHVHGLHLTKVDKVDNSCTKGGNVQYYICECGKWFSDEEGTVEIEDHSIVELDKLGHDYNESKVCNRCGEVEPNTVEAFVYRLYKVCLDRKPDKAGLKDWVGKLKSKEITGVQAAYGFIFSPEFKSKNLCNSDYVEYLYKAFMGRGSDPAGKKDWVSQLESGATREHVFNGFALSSEFGKICSNAGIAQGSGIAVPQLGTVPTGKCVVCGKDDGVTGFVKRLYKVCLDRTADPAGLKDWCGQLWSHVSSGSQVAYGFIFSDEFISKNYSNADYVEYLYKAFMGRGSDPAGKADWLSRMDSGWDRKQVFDGFVGSMEFTKICQSYGILR